MKVNFFDMKRESSRFIFKIKILSNISKIMNKGQFLFGDYSKKLEEKLSNQFGAEAILVKSGTDAITLSLMANNIGIGSKVALPAFSAIPTATAILATGATPVYVDVNYFDANININGLKNIINDIDAVVPVHLYGQPADMEEIVDICKNKIIIEDCAQAFGSKIGNKNVGRFGNCGAFSFYPSKNLGAYGDSGFIITENKNIANNLRELRFYGQKSQYEMGNHVGLNSRSDEIQCSILLEKLNEFPKIFEKKMKMKEKYIKQLSNNTIKWKDGALPHIFPILSSKRDDLKNKMDSCGIQTIIHYPFTLPKSVSKVNDNSFILSKRISNQEISIPFNSWLSNKEVDYIIENTLYNGGQ